MYDISDVERILCSKLDCDGVNCIDCPVDNLINELQDIINSIRGYDSNSNKIDER